MAISNCEVRELKDDELDHISGDATNIVNFGGGVSWVIQDKGMYLCTPDKCTHVPFLVM